MLNEKEMLDVKKLLYNSKKKEIIVHCGKENKLSGQTDRNGENMEVQNMGKKEWTLNAENINAKKNVLC